MDLYPRSSGDTGLYGEYMKKRIAFWDIARAIALFLVVLGHAVSDRGQLGFVVMIFHVPALLMVSGIVYQHGERGFGNFLWKKFRRILVPYYLFGLISIAIYAVLGAFAAESLGNDANEFGVGPNLFGLLYGNCKNGLMKFNLPLWFLPVLFLMEVFQYGAETLYRRLFPAGGHRRIYWLVVMGLCMALAQFNGLVPGLSNLPYNLETAEKLYFFFLMGVLLREESIRWESTLEKKTSGRWLLLAAGLVLLGVSLYLGFLNRRVIYTAGYYGTPWKFYLAAACGSLSVLLCSAAIHRCRWLEYLGQHTMSVLCLHKFPIVFCQILMPVLVATDITSMGVSVVTCVLCLAADLVIQKWFPFFLGDWYTKKEAMG